MIFKDRLQAGQMLGEKIAHDNPDLAGNPKVIVLGIPRGGVVVAAPVSKILKAPLDTVIVRKLGVPGHEELAFGAIDLDGNTVIDWELAKGLNLPVKAIEGVTKKELAEAKRRERVFSLGKRPLDLKDKEVIVVDDGVATGATVGAAVNYVLSKDPSKVILATPVIAADALSELNSKFQYSNLKQIPNKNSRNSKAAIEVIYLEAQENFSAVGQFYENFPQTEDGEVIRLLKG